MVDHLNLNIAHDDRYDERHFLIFNLIIPNYTSCSELPMITVHRYLFILNELVILFCFYNIFCLVYIYMNYILYYYVI